MFSENAKNASKMSQNHFKILQKTPRETPFPLRNQNPFQKNRLARLGRPASPQTPLARIEFRLNQYYKFRLNQ